MAWSRCLHLCLHDATIVVELALVAWSCHHHCDAITIVMEPPPLYDKGEEEKDKEEEEEEDDDDDEDKEDKAIIAHTLQQAQRICYTSTVTMQTRHHVLPTVANQIPTSPNLNFC